MDLKVILLLLLSGTPPGLGLPVPVMIWPGFAQLPRVDDDVVAATPAGQPGNPANEITSATNAQQQGNSEHRPSEESETEHHSEEVLSPFKTSDPSGNADTNSERSQSVSRINREDADEAITGESSDRGDHHPQRADNLNIKHTSNPQPGSLLPEPGTRAGNSTRSLPPGIALQKRNDDSVSSVPDNSGAESHLADSGDTADKGLSGPGVVVQGGGGAEDREQEGGAGGGRVSVSGSETPTEGEQGENGGTGTGFRGFVAGAEAPAARGTGTGSERGTAAEAPAGREGEGGLGAEGGGLVTAVSPAADGDGNPRPRISTEPASENGQSATARVHNLPSLRTSSTTLPNQPQLTTAAAANIPPVLNHNADITNNNNNHHNDQDTDSSNNNPQHSDAALPNSETPSTQTEGATAGPTVHPGTAAGNSGVESAGLEVGHTSHVQATNSSVAQSAAEGQMENAAEEQAEGSENKEEEISESGFGQPLVPNGNAGSSATTTATVMTTMTMTSTSLSPPSTPTSATPPPSLSVQPELVARGGEESPSTPGIRVTRSEPRTRPFVQSTPQTSSQSAASLHQQPPPATRFVPPPVLAGSTPPLTSTTTPPLASRPEEAGGQTTIVTGGGGGVGGGDSPVESSTTGSVPNENFLPSGLETSTVPAVVDPAAVPTTAPREVVHPVFPVDNTTTALPSPTPSSTSAATVISNATVSGSVSGDSQHEESTTELVSEASNSSAHSLDETTVVDPDSVSTPPETSSSSIERGTNTIGSASSVSSEPISHPEVRTLPTDAQGIVIVDHDVLASRSTSVAAVTEVPLPVANSSQVTAGMPSSSAASAIASVSPSMSNSSSAAAEQANAPNGAVAGDETSEKPEADKDTGHVTDAGSTPSLGSDSGSTRHESQPAVVTTSTPHTASASFEQQQGGGAVSSIVEPNISHVTSPHITATASASSATLPYAVTPNESTEFVLPPEFSGSGSGSGSGMGEEMLTSTTQAAAVFTSLQDGSVVSPPPTTSTSNGEVSTAHRGESNGQDEAKKESSGRPEVSTSAVDGASTSSPMADRTTTSELSSTADDGSLHVTDDVSSNTEDNNNNTDTNNTRKSGSDHENSNTDSQERNNTNDNSSSNNNNNNDDGSINDSNRGGPARASTPNTAATTTTTTTTTTTSTFNTRTTRTTTGTTTGRKGVVVVPETPGPVYIELKLGMTWSEFCSNVLTFYVELVDIVRQDGQQESFTADQIKLLANARKTCALATVRGRQEGLMEKAEIDVQLYLVNKSHHYDVLLTYVCARVIQQGFQIRERSVFQDKLLKVQLHELLEQEGEESVGGGGGQQGDDVSDEDDFLDAPGVTIVIVIAVIGGVCCITLIIMQIVLRKRLQEGVRTYNRSYSVTSVDSIALNNVTKSRPNSGISNPALDLFSERLPGQVSHPMNYTQLAAFVTDLENLYEEFQCIPNKTPRLSVVPNGAEDKNRFANILPIPETRVRLERDGQSEIAGYINANYVTGYNSHGRAYIATQALLDSTVCDFWRMVWQEGSKVIVMLINPHEDGHKKCATYFPDSVGHECAVLSGDYSVTMTKRDVHQEYITSWLTVKLIKTGETREVRHFWLTCWPISGRPDPISLVRFVLDCRPQYEDSGAPLVVHCSNGTARTGTFLALDISMRQYEDRRTVDVMGCVYGLRQERAGCVQTSEQYAILYQALFEYATILSSPGVSAASSATTLHNILS